jgi:hypothetical protein
VERCGADSSGSGQQPVACWWEQGTGAFTCNITWTLNTNRKNKNENGMGKEMKEDMILMVRLRTFQAIQSILYDINT